MYKLAVIIPAYKVLPYIVACVESLQKQYRPEIQYIFVNDGCPDNCLAVAASTFVDFFAANNVCIIEQENKGLCAARNVALNLVDAEYFTFVDSDDLILDGYAQILLSVLDSAATDIVQFNFTSFVDQPPFIDNAKTAISYFGDVDIVRDRVLGEGEWFCWRRIFKTMKYKHLQFIEGIMLEDIVYCAEAILYCNTITLLDNSLYGYRDNPHGISKYVDGEDELLREKWLFSMTKIYDYMSTDNRFDYRVTDWLDVLAVKFAPTIYIDRTSEPSFKKNYFLRCWQALRFSRGGKRVRRLCMLSWPKGYFILAKTIYAYELWNFQARLRKH